MAEFANTEPKTLIVGLGATGLSVARFLARRGGQVAITDASLSPPMLSRCQQELPDVALFLGGLDGHAFDSAERIVLSPGVAPDHPEIEAARARGVEIVGDIELFARAVQAPVVAVTGSNGKSTVTTLLREMAVKAGRAVRAGGNLGPPALDLIEDTEPDFYLLELSSFQLELTESLAPAVATVLNLSADHMDRYRDLDDYAGAKARVYRNARQQVVNLDDTRAAALADAARPCIGFTLGPPPAGGFGIRNDGNRDWIATAGRMLLPADELRIAGRHNLANALAALALGSAMGLDEPAMLRALRTFSGLPHRTQWVGMRDGVTWYNDSKGTNVGATLAALEGLPGPLVLIAGGEGKGADFSPLREAVRDKARAVILIGRDARAIETALAGAVPVVHAASMEEAVDLAAGLARPGDAVLLSPACASFDMFADYQARGQAFIEAVRRRTG